ncbi:hypothetical protein CDAR_97481 [Caerostris darwini]|uniref:Uncharacterized protein n=1 Tax=Caerostris darwini TaxID=1538125 RepID=A0AAV4PR06_9ARAC|nr:hypothetical protein CDAR_97481 [Caerostris darwini]
MAQGVPFANTASSFGTYSPSPNEFFSQLSVLLPQTKSISVPHTIFNQEFLLRLFIPVSIVFETEKDCSINLEDGSCSNTSLEERARRIFARRQARQS